MLFLKEMKKIILSIPYLLFVIAITIGLYSQDVFHFGDDRMQEPQPGESYGFKQAEIPEQIMPAALADFWGEFCANRFTTYPIGFVKSVKLGEKERAKAAEILSEITGKDAKELLRQSAEGSPNSENNLSMEIGAGQMQPDGEGGFVISPEGARSSDNLPEDAPKIRADMDYSRYKVLMQQLDDLLGGGSKYAAESLIGYGQVPLTYEEAKQRYETAVGADQITGGYARLFCDYAGVIAFSVLPVFLAVILSMKDRHARMESLIYTKAVSAARLIFVRYFALIFAAMLPALFLSYLSNIPVWSAYSGMQLDYLAPLKYDLGWLLPSVMISTAIGMVLTELTGAPVAIGVQGLWWMFDVNLGIQTVDAGYRLTRLSPRHNVGPSNYFRTQDYLDHFSNLVQNRLLIAGLSLLLVALTVFLYEAKRKGRFGGSLSLRKAVSRLGNRKNQPAA